MNHSKFLFLNKTTPSFLITTISFWSSSWTLLLKIYPCLYSTPTILIIRVSGLWHLFVFDTNTCDYIWLTHLLKLLVSQHKQVSSRSNYNISCHNLKQVSLRVHDLQALTGECVKKRRYLIPSTLYYQSIYFTTITNYLDNIIVRMKQNLGNNCQREKNHILRVNQNGKTSRQLCMDNVFQITWSVHHVKHISRKYIVVVAKCKTL
jgi:hypothetical protein